MHSHDHTHELTITHDRVSRAFIFGISVNLLFVIIEVGVGVSIHSLSLLSDAGHNFIDVIGLLLSLLGFRLAKVKSNDNYTYGYKKTSVLVALFNSMVLLGSIGAITYEAIHRFFSPEAQQGDSIAIVAGIGILINASSAMLFFREKGRDLNIKSAYLHLFSDALVSVGIVIGGILIIYTKWVWIDPLLSIIIVLVIFWSTWSLFRDSLRLSMDGVPKDVDIEEVKKVCLNNLHVRSIHHMHIWSMSTSEVAMTAHLVLETGLTGEDMGAVKKDIRHELSHLAIHHVTLETEQEVIPCDDEDCH